MKYIKSILYTITAGSVIFFSSCKKEYFTDVNENTNAPASVLPGNILTGVEASLAYSQGGDMSRFTSLITQQTLGASRQASAYYSYVFTSQDFDNLWGNLYTSTMQNCNDLITQSDAKQYNAYSGVGRLLMAYSLQITVDCWGKIPYSQAFKGLENLHPVYDSDVSLYATINAMVDEGIANLSSTSQGVIVPGGEDFIYGGDVDKWIRFGHAIKARLAIHQSKTNPSFAQTALDEANLSFGSNADNAQFRFGVTETSANPWYQFNEQRGDVSFATAPLADSMIVRADPRYPILIDSLDDVDGLGLAEYYGGADGYVDLICYDEIQFIIAEASIRATGDFATAQTAYTAGITANMDKLGVAAPDAAPYIAAYGTISGTDAASAIASIANEEYYALYLNPEAWTVYRRTGSPVLTPVTGTLGVPRRFLYVQTEYSYNGANTPISTLFSPKVFWDN